MIGGGGLAAAAAFLTGGGSKQEATTAGSTATTPAPPAARRREHPRPAAGRAARERRQALPRNPARGRRAPQPEDARAGGGRARRLRAALAGGLAGAPAGRRQRRRDGGRPGHARARSRAAALPGAGTLAGGDGAPVAAIASKRVCIVDPRPWRARRSASRRAASASCEPTRASWSPTPPGARSSRLHRAGAALKPGPSIPVGAKPHGPLASFSGKVYVAITRGIAVVDLAGKAKTTVIRLPTSAAEIWISPAGRLFATLPASDAVAVVTLAAGARPVVRTVAAGHRPQGVAGAGGTVYVANAADGTVTLLAAGTGAAVGAAHRVAALQRAARPAHGRRLAGPHGECDDGRLHARALGQSADAPRRGGGAGPHPGRQCAHPRLEGRRAHAGARRHRRRRDAARRHGRRPPRARALGQGARVHVAPYRARARRHAPRGDARARARRHAAPCTLALADAAQPVSDAAQPIALADAAAEPAAVADPTATAPAAATADRLSVGEWAGPQGRRT